jgi:hypothetical protein
MAKFLGAVATAENVYEMALQRIRHAYDLSSLSVTPSSPFLLPCLN